MAGNADRGDPDNAGRTNETDFLGGIADDAYRAAMTHLFSSAGALGLITYWGSKGSSLRIKTPDRAEPLSIAWTFLEGSQWYGARHLSLGVDQSSLNQTPSVRLAVDTFVRTVMAIPGGKPVTSPLDAYTFDPAEVPGVMPAIIVALEELVNAVHSLGDRGGAEP